MPALPPVPVLDPDLIAPTVVTPVSAGPVEPVVLLGPAD
jgi:hypothetical protein